MPTTARIAIVPEAGDDFTIEERAIADPVLEGASFAHTFESVAGCVEELARRLDSNGVSR